VIGRKFYKFGFPVAGNCTPQQSGKKRMICEVQQGTQGGRGSASRLLPSHLAFNFPEKCQADADDGVLAGSVAFWLA
jgi:hypothetical protein